MASEFTPPGQGARMTKAQVRRYIRNMKQQRELAKQKLEEMQNSGELEKEQAELEKLESEIDRLNGTHKKETTVNTNDWEILSPDDFLRHKKLYNKFLGFTIGKANLKTIFTDQASTKLKDAIEKYYEKQGKISKQILASTEYPNYIYVETTEMDYVIRI